MRERYFVLSSLSFVADAWDNKAERVHYICGVGMLRSEHATLDLESLVEKRLGLSQLALAPVAYGQHAHTRKRLGILGTQTRRR
jgi:hypothetical protein